MVFQGAQLTQEPRDLHAPVDGLQEAFSGGLRPGVEPPIQASQQTLRFGPILGSRGTRHELLQNGPSLLKIVDRQGPPGVLKGLSRNGQGGHDNQGIGNKSKVHRFLRSGREPSGVPTMLQ